jgi:hypothetical protein
VLCELIEWLLRKFNTEIVAVYSEDVDPTEWAAEDILVVFTVFAARVHGMRSYKRALTAELDGGEEECAGKPGGNGAQTNETQAQPRGKRHCQAGQASQNPIQPGRAIQESKDKGNVTRREKGVPMAERRTENVDRVHKGPAARVQTSKSKREDSILEGVEEVAQLVGAGRK